MLKIRVIPCLDVKDGRVVKGINFVNLIDAGDPVEQAKAYEQQGADELCFLDITASNEDRENLYHIVEQVAETCFMPLTVGGGVRNLDNIRKLLESGADKVSINSASVYNPDFVYEAAKKFGSQCVVIAIDAKFNHNANRYEIYTHGGKKETGIEALEWAKKMENLGAGEILLTCMDKDGTKSGFDNKLNYLISSNINIPLIASGGVGKIDDFAEGYLKGGATGLLAASVFHFGEVKISEVKQDMKDKGIAVRI
jgi:cyclase